MAGKLNPQTLKTAEDIAEARATLIGDYRAGSMSDADFNTDAKRIDTRETELGLAVEIVVDVKRTASTATAPQTADVTELTPARFAKAMKQALEKHCEETGDSDMCKWALVKATETYIDEHYPDGWRLVDVTQGCVLELLLTAHGLSLDSTTERLSTASRTASDALYAKASQLLEATASAPAV